MFFNIGADCNVFYKDIAAIINIEKLDSVINNNFIQYLINRNHCVILDKTVSRSLIVLYKNGITEIYLSPLSVSAIKKRFSVFNKNLLNPH